MLIDYLGLRPINLTLMSGKSFYAYPKQTGISISGQDWHLSKRLQPLKKQHLFRVREEHDEQAQPKKRSVRAKDLVLDKPNLDTAKQPETLVYSVKTDKPIGTRPVEAKDIERLVTRKHIKIKRNKDQDSEKS